MPGRHPSCCAVLLGRGPARGAAACWRPEPRTSPAGEIKAVRVEGNVTLTEEDLLYYLGLEPGSTYDPPAQRSPQGALGPRPDRRRRDRRRAARRRRRVKVTIEERPTLVSIDYQGLDKLKRTDITEMIDKKRHRAVRGQPALEGRAGAARGGDRGDLRREGLPLRRRRRSARAGLRPRAAGDGPDRRGRQGQDRQGRPSTATRSSATARCAAR